MFNFIQRINMRSLITMVCSCLLFYGCKAQNNNPAFKVNKDDNSLLWMISGKGLDKPSFIFGTFHLLCKDDIKLSEQLKKAINFSDKIYMEMDMDDPSTMMSALLYMNMKDGKKLKDLYTNDEYKKLERYFSDSLGMPMMMFQTIKPYFLVAMLYPKMMNCSNASGVEEELMKVAKENKKEIKGLETMQFQASVFDSIPYEWQAKELLKNIDSFSTYKIEFDIMVLQYKSQQLSGMEKMINKNEFGSEKYEDILLTRRNINWVSQLKDIMKKESVFVAVGTGHLVGEKGILNLLRKNGYTVEPLLNK